MSWLRNQSKVKDNYISKGIVSAGAGLFAWLTEADPDSIFTIWAGCIVGTQATYAVANIQQKKKTYNQPDKVSSEVRVKPDKVVVRLKRLNSQPDYTEGELIYGVHRCDTLEDQHQEIKVRGETRIPAGQYRLDWNNRQTALTEKYQNDKRYKDFFKWHVEIKDVPGFKGIYIHVGNDDDDTNGCPLLGKKIRDGYIGSSAVTYTHFYKWIKPLLDGGKDVWIDIHD